MAVARRKIRKTNRIRVDLHGFTRTTREEKRERSAHGDKDALLLLKDRRHPFDFQRLWKALDEVCRMLKGLIRTTKEWARRKNGG